MRSAFATTMIAVTFSVLAIESGAGSGRVTSSDKVKASAVATKADANGEQTVTITLAIEKGWHLYANPVNHNHEFLNNGETKVTIRDKSKVETTVKYPAGKRRLDFGEKYDVYEGTIKIDAKVKRSNADTSPLDIVINVLADKVSGGYCLLPGIIKLKVQ